VFHDGEVITWNKVTTSIRNLILGKIYVEHSGTMKVQSEQMSLEFRIKFKDSGIISSSMHEISGRLHENGRDLHTHKCVPACCVPVGVCTDAPVVFQTSPTRIWNEQMQPTWICTPCSSVFAGDVQIKTCRLHHEH
jgi:hypothetical protein